MGARAKAIFPLALVVGVLSYLWTEFSLNFTFHWVTLSGSDLPGSVGVPQDFHFILPTAFITWGLFFAAGGDNAAFGKIFLAAVFGSVAALVTIPLAYKSAAFPDFWGIALWVGILAFVVQTFVAGSYSSTALKAPQRPDGSLEPYPPIAYTLPLLAAARPSPYRAVGMLAFDAHAFVAGSYSSSTATGPLGVYPPTAYTFPFAALANPSPCRAGGMLARAVQTFVAGSYSSTVATWPATPYPPTA